MGALRNPGFSNREKRDPENVCPFLKNIHLHTIMRIAIGAGFCYKFSFQEFSFSAVNNHGGAGIIVIFSWRENT
ncbi:MAG: hypothetical protein V4456_23605 [Bacteroidota bacterium]